MTAEKTEATAPEHRRNTRQIERALGDWTRARLPHVAAEFVMFVLKLGWASLFGGLLLIGIIATKMLWSDGAPVYRYDILFAYAVSLQILFLWFRLESLDEARVIVLFHLTGTAMEFFKVQAGSWAYPEPGLVKILDVPLFSGFMYASVGSFMARAIRLFDMHFTPYPPFRQTLVLTIAIYVNFFAHHFLPDIRLVLFAATVVLFFRTRVTFHIGDNDYWMPMVLAGVLTSFFLWVAENIGTRTNTWIYPGQGEFDWVSLSKMGSWYLLIWVSFVTVTLVFREALGPASKMAGPHRPSNKSSGNDQKIQRVSAK